MIGTTSDVGKQYSKNERAGVLAEKLCIPEEAVTTFTLADNGSNDDNDPQIDEDEPQLVHSKKPNFPIAQ